MKIGTAMGVAGEVAFGVQHVDADRQVGGILGMGHGDDGVVTPGNGNAVMWRAAVDLTRFNGFSGDPGVSVEDAG